MKAADDAMVAQAELSHRVERVTIALCRDDPDDLRVELYVEELAESNREAVALALSYALRRRDLDGSEPVIDRTIGTLAAIVRRMPRQDHAAEDGED